MNQGHWGPSDEASAVGKVCCWACMICSGAADRLSAVAPCTAASLRIKVLYLR
jgi:hypothetical protein